MPAVDYGCKTCGLVIEEIRKASEIETPPTDDDGNVLKCELCKGSDWVLPNRIYPPAFVRVSEKSRGRARSSYEFGQKLEADRTVWPMKSNFSKKVVYTENGVEKVRKEPICFDTRKEYEQYMDKNGYVYHEEDTSPDPAPKRFLNKRHEDLFNKYGNGKPIMDGKFLTEGEIADAKLL